MGRYFYSARALLKDALQSSLSFHRSHIKTAFIKKIELSYEEALVRPRDKAEVKLLLFHKAQDLLPPPSAAGGLE